MLAPFTCFGDFFLLKFVRNLYFKVVFYQIIKKRFVFFLAFFTRKNSKNDVKISSLVNIRKNVIQNVEVDIAIMC